MTRQELKIKAKEFDSNLNRHPMSSEELQTVLCDFVEALRIHDVVGRSEQLVCPHCTNPHLYLKADNPRIKHCPSCTRTWAD